MKSSYGVLNLKKSKSNAKVAWDIFIIFLGLVLEVQYVKSQNCKGKGLIRLFSKWVFLEMASNLCVATCKWNLITNIQQTIGTIEENIPIPLNIDTLIWGDENAF